MDDRASLRRAKRVGTGSCFIILPYGARMIAREASASS